MSRNLDNQHGQWDEWFDHDRIIRSLETIQNAIIIALSVGLFCVMLIRLGDLFLSLLVPLKFQNVTSDILFILILIELFRLLIIYLKEQRISIGVSVEVSIVSVLREVIIRGALEISGQQILAICAFLLVLGGLLLIRAWMLQIFSSIEAEEKQFLLEEQVINDEDFLN